MTPVVPTVYVNRYVRDFVVVYSFVRGWNSGLRNVSTGRSPEEPTQVDIRQFGHVPIYIRRCYKKFFYPYIKIFCRGPTEDRSLTFVQTLSSTNETVQRHVNEV